MSRTTDNLKKLLVRITTATCCDDIQGNTMCEILEWGRKNLNVDSNGKIACKDYVEPSEPSAVALTAFKNGDIYKTGTRLVFPKSQMANLEAFFRDRLANWTFGEDFDMLHEKGSSGGVLVIMNAGGIGIFMLPTGEMSGVLWLSADYPDMGLTAGWQYQNLVDEGDNYVFIAGEGVEAEIDTEIDFDGKAYLDQWNGIMIGIDNSQVQGE